MSLLSVSSVHFKSVRLAVRRVAGITGAKGSMRTMRILEPNVLFRRSNSLHGQRVDLVEIMPSIKCLMKKNEAWIFGIAMIGDVQSSHSEQNHTNSKKALRMSENVNGKNRKDTMLTLVQQVQNSVTNHKGAQLGIGGRTPFVRECDFLE